jgi:Dolichyl-phosphate-mannose-protein mannosyltransferase
MDERSFRQIVQLGILLAVIKVGLHIVTNIVSQHVGYGLIRDEMYYLICGQRLAFGYVDHPPLVALQARLSQMLFGYDRMWSLRLFAALAGGIKVLLTGLLVWSLGGGKAGSVLGMYAVLTVPVYLALDSFLSMNAFDPVFWMTAMLAAIRLVNLRDVSPANDGRRWWLLLGLSVGLGLENKASEIFFLVCLFVALVITPARRILASRWCLVAAGLILLLALPNLLWQVGHHFPTWEWLQAMQHSPIEIKLSPFHMLLGQLLMLGPVHCLLWISGLIWLLFSKEALSWRFVGIFYLLFLSLMMALHAKDYYLAPAYPVFFAAGAVAWMNWTVFHPRFTEIAQPAIWSYSILLLLSAAIMLPFAIPVLSPVKYLAYAQTLHFHPHDEQVHDPTLLPQFFADRFGWTELLTKTSSIYHALPIAEQARTGILVENYGEASAITLLGRRYRLPEAISGHQNFWLWGTRGYSGEEMIVVTQASEAELERYYRSCARVAMRTCQFAMPWERGPIYLCRARKDSYAADWSHFKEFR